MPFIIITRDELKQLKVQAEEEKRRAEEEKRRVEIENAIQTVYNHVIGSAKIPEWAITKCLVAVGHTGHQPQAHRFGDFFRCIDPKQHHRIPSIAIPSESIPLVISGLQELFPDSNVSVMAPAPDGKMYEVSAATSPFIQPHALKAIVVDWS